MSFIEYCEANNAYVYETICRYIPWREPKGHYKMVREYTERRGKYGRPNLALLWCELYGGKKEDVFLLACAIQAGEDWLLMHDDWMDHNELRRGKRTAHLLYGENMAINAGDALHMVMWKLVRDGSDKVNMDIGERLFEKFYDIMLVTTEGQYYDLELSGRKDLGSFTLDDYWRSIHAKAAYYSYYGPMQLGAIAAGRSDKEVRQIEEYGIKAGQAFQVKDDILDCVSTPETIGKSIGNDVYEGTKTAILWHFLQNAAENDLEQMKQIYGKDRDSKSEEDVMKAIDLFEQYGSIKFAQDLVDKLAGEALEKFEVVENNVPESGLKAAARDVICRMWK